MHDGDEGYQPSSDEPMHLHSDDDDGGSSAIHSVIAIANEVTTVPKRPQQRDNTSKRPREEDVSDTLPPTQRHRQTLPGGRGHRACTPSTHENDAIRFDGSPTDSQALNGHISDNDTHTSTKQASGSNSGNVGQGAVPSSLASDCSSTAASKIMAQIGHVLTGWDKDVQELNAPSNAIERLAEINALSVDLQNLEEDEVIAKKALIASQYQLRKSVEAQQKRQSSRDKIKRHLGGLANDDGGVGDDRAELATTVRRPARKTMTSVRTAPRTMRQAFRSVPGRSAKTLWLWSMRPKKIWLRV